MKGYYKGLIIAAAIVSSVIADSNRNTIRLENILIRNLPNKIQSELIGPFSSASGAATGGSLMYVTLLPYLKRKEY